MRDLQHRDGAPLHQVDDGSEAQTRRQHRDERQQTDSAQGSPGGEQKPDREREIPRTHLVRDMQRCPIIAAEHETRNCERQLPRTHEYEPDPDRQREPTPLPVIDRAADDRRRQVGHVDTTEQR